jgi:putative FmdB family regulatory protein
MADYEYECTQCKKRFTVKETFEQHDRHRQPKCPSCKSQRVERVIEAVHVRTSKKT